MPKIYNRLEKMSRKVSKEKIDQLNEEMHQAVRELLTSEAKVIRKLQEVDHYLVPQFLQYASLHQYAVGELELSENQAYDFVAVAQACSKHPYLAEAVLTSKLSVSKARRILPVIDNGEEESWVELAISEPKHIVEKCIREFKHEGQAEPEPSEDYLIRARQLITQKLGRRPSQQELIAYLAKDFVIRHDPVKRSERRLKREAKKTAQDSRDSRDSKVNFGLGQTASLAEPSACLSRHIARVRDKQQCQFDLPNGHKCGARIWIDIHHVKPTSQGGSDEPQNLTTLCRAHHALTHFNLET